MPFTLLEPLNRERRERADGGGARDEGDEGLVCAYLLDGEGGGRRLDWEEVERWKPSDGPLWVHLNRSVRRTRTWLTQPASQGGAGLDPIIAEAMLEPESRPRSVRHGDGLLVSLRGVNFNPGSHPEDMIAMRFWLEGNRLITTRRRFLMGIREMCERLEGGQGPRDITDCLLQVADSIVYRAGQVLVELEDRIDDIEHQATTEELHRLRDRLSVVRRRAIALRRYLAPQREALARLQADEHALIDARDKVSLRELTDQTVRYVEDLDSVRERASVVQDEVTNRMQERMNRNTYVLSVVATIVLPLSFVTGLLGVNIGGMNEGRTTFEFWYLCGGLALLAVLQLVMFRWLKWM